MFKKLSRLGLTSSLGLLFLIAGCGGKSIPTASPEPSQPMLTRPSVSTPLSDPTTRPTPPPALPITISTPPTPIPQTLTERQPSVSQLKTYLHFNDVGVSDDTALEQGQLIYQDVSGDGEADLIIDDYNYLQVIVLLWQMDHYAKPFQLEHDAWKYFPNSRVFLEDWTRDGIPEVIFDYLGDTGGTGITVQYWHRDIIHCGTDCAVVWSENIAVKASDDNDGGLESQQSQLRLQQTSAGQPQIRVFTTDFSIYSYWDYSPGATYDTYGISALRIFTSTVSLYDWTGSKFELTDTQIASLPQIITSQAALDALSSNGQHAKIGAEPNGYVDAANYVCQLYLDTKPVGPRFGCKRDFTTVQWKDINNDGAEELVIIALSGRQPKDGEGNRLGEIDCVHQHLLAYQSNGAELLPIANVAGCVVRQDLYGVQLQDLDADGILEILVAELIPMEAGCPWSNTHCWQEPDSVSVDKIYKWNGAKYVLWGTLP